MPASKSPIVVYARVVSPAFSSSRFTIARPRLVRPSSGTSYAFILKTRPVSVKHSRLSCVLATNTCSMKSPSFESPARMPLPPRACARYVSAGTRFTYPWCEIVTATSCSWISSSIEMSPAASSIEVSRGRLYRSRISAQSSLMIPTTRPRSARIAS